MPNGISAGEENDPQLILDLSIFEIESRISLIDQQIGLQIDKVLHHPDFQSLESSWCGLRNVVESVANSVRRESELSRERGDGFRFTAESETVRGETEDFAAIVSILPIHQHELSEEASEVYHRTELYNKLYQDEYNTFGGCPFSVMLVDFEYGISPQDLAVLRMLSQIGASAFTAIVANASPELFGIDCFQNLPSCGLGNDEVMPEPLTAPDWLELRRASESRFLSLVAPRVLMRRPYSYSNGLREQLPVSNRDSDQIHSFRYTEATKPDGSHHLWGSAGYAFLTTVADCFLHTGWLADIHGIPADGWGSGLSWRRVSDRDQPRADRPGLVFKPATEVVITDALEKRLSSLGFMVLTHRFATPDVAFCSTPSLYLTGDDKSVDEKIGSFLQYTLCVARFAHNIKRLAHHKTGSLLNQDEVREFLNEYLGEFVEEGRDPTAQQKAKKPLRRKSVTVRPTPGRTGHFECQILLQMHHELETVNIELSTELSKNDDTVGDRQS